MVQGRVAPPFQGPRVAPAAGRSSGYSLKAGWVGQAFLPVRQTGKSVPPQTRKGQTMCQTPPYRTESGQWLVDSGKKQKLVARPASFDRWPKKEPGARATHHLSAVGALVPRHSPLITIKGGRTGPNPWHQQEAASNSNRAPKPAGVWRWRPPIASLGIHRQRKASRSEGATGGLTSAGCHAAGVFSVLASLAPQSFLAASRRALRTALRGRVGEGGGGAQPATAGLPDAAEHSACHDSPPFRQGICLAPSR